MSGPIDLTEDQKRHMVVVAVVAKALVIFLLFASLISVVMWVIRFGFGPIQPIAPNPNANIRWWQAPIIAAAAAALTPSVFLANSARLRAAAWMIVLVVDFLLIVQALSLSTTVPMVMGFVVPCLVTAILLDARSTFVHGLFTFVVGVVIMVFEGVVNPMLSTTIGMFFTVISLSVAVSLVRERDVDVLQDLRAAELVEAERIQGELHLARRVQLAMHPTEYPTVEGTGVAAFSEPAFEASGDFYDVFNVVDPTNEHVHLGIVVCDVAGKGIASALVMSATRASLRASASRVYSPAAVLAEVNNTLASSIPPELFVTACYAIFDPETRTLVHASAGHPHPLLWDPSADAVSELQSFGLPLGLVADAEYDDCSSVIQRGSTVVAYSDGLPEAMNSVRELYGFDRVERSVDAAARAGGTAEEQLDHILASLRDFVKDTPLDDDVTAVVLA